MLLVHIQSNKLSNVPVAVNARLVKKQKSPQRSSGMNAEQKVEGLRSRLKKSTIEAAIELRAKRDIPAVSPLCVSWFAYCMLFMHTSNV